MKTQPIIFGICLTHTLLGSPNAFVPRNIVSSLGTLRKKSSLNVSVGLGPEEKQEERLASEEVEVKVEVPEPDHELFRTSRLTPFDKKCDDWYGSLLSGEGCFLGEVSTDAWQRINSLVELKRKPLLKFGEDDWTPYQSNPLPGTPILPAYGLETYGLPIPRRNAEAWRNLDVNGLVSNDYSGIPDGIGNELILEESVSIKYKEILEAKGVWVDDEACAGRLIYINGRFVPSISRVTDIAMNLSPDYFSSDDVSAEVLENMKRLTDGFTDRLAADVPSGETDYLTSLKSLSGPDHNVGEATSQFAINGQQGTACFVALNSVKAGAVAYVNVPSSSASDTDIDTNPETVAVINVITTNGGFKGTVKDEKGVASHPRSLVMVGDNSRISFVQSFIDIDESDTQDFVPTLVNGCTQIYVGSGANVTHSYIEEAGGMVTASVEESSRNDEEGVEPPRVVESKRKTLRNTHFESVDVHVTGDNGAYKGVVMALGGNGFRRISVGTSLLRPGAHAAIHGFSLAGGNQRLDLRTLIHHIGQATTSEQSQKNMISGRATTSFRGRIRVEQSAQQTESSQITRNILLTDRSRVWAVPSLEIIADDVVCTHGATISDLEEEALFYLRSRGLDRISSRNLLMYAFAEDISCRVDKRMQGSYDSPKRLKNRIIQRLQNLVPRGDRAIKGEFQSV